MDNRHVETSSILQIFSSCWMRQGTNKQEKPQIFSKIIKHLFLIAVIKNYYALKFQYLHRKKTCVLVDLHNYRMCSDFKLHVWGFFRSRSMKTDKMHQSSGFISRVLPLLLIFLSRSGKKLFPVKECCYFFDCLTVRLNIVLWQWHKSVNKSHLPLHTTRWWGTQ